MYAPYRGLKTIKLRIQNAQERHKKLIGSKVTATQSWTKKRKLGGKTFKIRSFSKFTWKISILQKNICVLKVSRLKDEHFLYFVFFPRTHILGPNGQNRPQTSLAELNFATKSAVAPKISISPKNAKLKLILFFNFMGGYYSTFCCKMNRLLINYDFYVKIGVVRSAK